VAGQDTKTESPSFQL